MTPDHRFRLAFTLVLTIAVAAASVSHAQQGVAGGLPASAVMARGGTDGWQSRGGVVGPWWSGSSAGAPPPAADGGFWFGWPGLGFGGSQGSARGLGMQAPSVTTTPGAAGMVSSSRLVPFVTGVVPVVGTGAPLVPSTTAATLPWSSPPGPRTLTCPPSLVPGPVAASGGAIPARPSSPGGRVRAQRLVGAGDRRLLEGGDGPVVSRAALGDYRAAAQSARTTPISRSGWRSFTRRSVKDGMPTARSRGPRRSTAGSRRRSTRCPRMRLASTHRPRRESQP